MSETAAITESPMARFGLEIRNVVESFDEDLDRGDLALELLRRASVLLVWETDTCRRAYNLTNEAVGELLKALEAAA